MCAGGRWSRSRLECIRVFGGARIVFTNRAASCYRKRELPARVCPSNPTSPARQCKREETSKAPEPTLNFPNFG